MYSWTFLLLAVVNIYSFSALSKAEVIPEDVVISISSGNIVGSTTVSADAKSINQYKGIPYAIAPIGERRWRSTSEVEPWAGIRMATQFSPACVQPYMIKDRDFPFYYSHNMSVSEDCLYINVWAPSAQKNALSEVEKKYPVMVWIHGGGLLAGSSAMPICCDAASLASKGVVVVSFNYRLGVLGYFSHPELTAESANKASGNYGTQDQVLALRWVKKNISAFGGDPNNVTIFGESAGALSVGHLMSSPLAKGLFHKAIMQSSYLPPMQPLSVAEQRGESLAKSLGSKTLAELRTMTAVKIVAASMEQPGITKEPEAVVDGWIFPEDLYHAFKEKIPNNVPLLFGFNSGDGNHFPVLPQWSAAAPDNGQDYVRQVNHRYGALAEDYLAVYPPSNLKNAVLHPIRDRFYGWPTESYARAVVQQGKPAYFYYFDHAMPKIKQMGLTGFHASELPFTFNNLHRIEQDWPQLGTPTEADYKLADAMSDYWVNFAKHGTPIAKGQPQWPAYDPVNRHYMAFENGKAMPKKNLNPGAWELHQKIYERRKALGMKRGFLDIGLLSPPLVPANTHKTP